MKKDLQQLFNEFMYECEYVRKARPETLKGYLYAFNLLCKIVPGISLVNIVPETITRFFQILHERKRVVGKDVVKVGIKKSTTATYWRKLNTFFEWLAIGGFAQKLIKTANLTKQDALQLLEVVYNYPYEYPFVRYRNHAMFSMFIFAGLRKQELLKLRYTDVDLENLTIFVRQGKGAKDRIVPITYTLAQRLKRYLEHRKRLHKTCPEFFVSLCLNCGFTADGLEHFVKDLRKATTIKFSIHKLRHTFATLMLEGGCDIYSISKMMGHSDIKTTTIYLAASPEHLRFAITKDPLNDLVSLRC